MVEIEWEAGRWLNQPPSVRREGSQLLVEAKEGSDFWRTTSYGFVHDDGHGLLAPLEVGEAVEVSFFAELPEQFDQAGLLLRRDETDWLKAGLERSDGVLWLGAVATRRRSDWSLAPASGWSTPRSPSGPAGAGRGHRPGPSRPGPLAAPQGGAARGRWPGRCRPDVLCPHQERARGPLHRLAGGSGRRGPARGLTGAAAGAPAGP